MTVKIEEPLPLVPMDFVLIVQVLVNLIDNAVKYSPAESPVDIQACQSGAEIQVCIEDSGVGIPPDDLERVFEKFYRIERPEKISGTGLGLSISKGIIEAHGGSIRAENRQGGGTRMTFNLPLTRKGEPEK